MSDKNSYELLGITEASTFEEIQEARDRLVHQYIEEPKQQAAVEAAYDAILMERLRLRQVVWRLPLKPVWPRVKLQRLRTKSSKLRCRRW